MHKALKLRAASVLLTACMALILVGMLLLSGCGTTKEAEGGSSAAGMAEPQSSSLPAGEAGEPVEIDLYAKGITDEELAAMVEAGDIPANVSKLVLKANKISDLSPLQNLTYLEHINLDYNQISDLSPLQSLSRLTFLRLDVNQISDLSPLETMTGLTELHLWKNEISDLGPLKNLTALTILYLDENQISDISALKGLTRLEVLDLSFNEIDDWEPVSHLEEVGGRP